MNSPIARKEPRIRSRGFVHLVVGEFQRIEATICDVSPSGISLEAAEGVPLGTRVNIDVGLYTSEGVVRHCSANGSQYRIGVELHAGNVDN
jgi:hypothetical protein